MIKHIYLFGHLLNLSSLLHTKVNRASGGIYTPYNRYHKGLNLQHTLTESWEAVL